MSFRFSHLALTLVCVLAVLSMSLIPAPAKAFTYNEYNVAMLGNASFILCCGDVSEEGTIDRALADGMYSYAFWSNANATVDTLDGVLDPHPNFISGYFDQIGLIGLLSGILNSYDDSELWSYGMSVTVIPVLAPDVISYSDYPHIIDYAYIYTDDGADTLRYSRSLSARSFRNVFTFSMEDDSISIGNISALFNYISNSIYYPYEGNLITYFLAEDRGTSFPLLSIVNYTYPETSFDPGAWQNLMDTEKDFIRPILSWTWSTWPFLVFIFGALLISGVLVSLIK